MLRAFAYHSKASPDFQAERSIDLVRDAANFNRIAGVTGAMIFDGKRFLQYLEGPEDGLRGAMGRILSSRSHSDVLIVGQGSIAERHFSSWAMTLSHQSESTLSVISASNWDVFSNDFFSAPGKMALSR